MSNEDTKTAATVVQAVLGSLPSLSSETPKSSTPTVPETESSQSSENSKTCPVEGSISLPAIHRKTPEFRSRIFGIDETHHLKVKQMAEWGEWFFRRAVNNERSTGHQLVLCGGVGVGKTDRIAKPLYRQLGAWAPTAMMAPGWKGRFPFVWWVDWSDAVECDRETFDDIREEIQSAEIVFLDDVGAEVDRFKTGETTSRLRTILGTCANKWLLVTTNLTKQQFTDRYDVRVADRLSAAHWCDMSGVPSYRPKLKHGRPKPQTPRQA